MVFGRCQDAEFEIHVFWQTASEAATEVVSRGRVNRCCRVENGLQSAKLTGRKSSKDSVAVGQP